MTYQPMKSQTSSTVDTCGERRSSIRSAELFYQQAHSEDDEDVDDEENNSNHDSSIESSDSDTETENEAIKKDSTIKEGTTNGIPYQVYFSQSLRDAANRKCQNERQRASVVPDSRQTLTTDEHVNNEPPPKKPKITYKRCTECPKKKDRLD
ncbi:hypothetical protein X975_10058, partial [Stegodyphus mimosarum]